MVSMLPVVATQSSPTRGINALDDKSPTTRNRRVTSSKIPVSLEKSVHGTGDCKRPLSTPGRYSNDCVVLLKFSKTTNQKSP